MASLVSDIITQAFVDLAVIAPGETISSSMQSAAFLVFQQMMQSWAIEPTMNDVIHTTVTPVAGTADYSYGVAGTFSTSVPPLVVLGWRSRDSGGYQTAGRALSFNEFEQDPEIQDNLATSSKLVRKLAADRGDQLSGKLILIRLWPTPAASPGTLVLDTLFMPAAFTFSAVSDSLSAFGPGFEAAMHFSLALQLWSQYPNPGILDTLAANAKNAKQAISGLNAAALGINTTPPAA